MNNKVIKIGKLPAKEYLITFALVARDNDQVEVHYRPHTESEAIYRYLMDLIRKALNGQWVIILEEEVLIRNKRCRFEDENHACNNPEVMHPGKCNEAVK